MPKPFEKITNHAIEISSNPPIQKMPDHVDTSMANSDLPKPSSNPFPSSYKEIASVQKNTYRGFNRN